MLIILLQTDIHTWKWSPAPPFHHTHEASLAIFGQIRADYSGSTAGEEQRNCSWRRGRSFLEEKLMPSDQGLLLFLFKMRKPASELAFASLPLEAPTCLQRGPSLPIPESKQERPHPAPGRTTQLGDPLHQNLRSGHQGTGGWGWGGGRQVRVMCGTPAEGEARVLLGWDE